MTWVFTKWVQSASLYRVKMAVKKSLKIGSDKGIWVKKAENGLKIGLEIKQKLSTLRLNGNRRKWTQNCI